MGQIVSPLFFGSYAAPAAAVCRPFPGRFYAQRVICTAIHSPSFQYADRILRDWKKAGVKKMEDVRALDARRQALVQENGGDKEKRLQRYNSASKDGGGKKNSQNQFHNFKQRDTDYDALMLKQVKEWVGGGRPRT